MPIHTENRAANRFLEMFTYPPIPLFIKTADSNCSSTRSTRKFILERRPSNKCGSSVQTEKHKSRLPRSITLGLPNICIPLELAHSKFKWQGSERHILRTGNNAVRLRCPINTCDKLIVLFVVISKNQRTEFGVRYIRKGFGFCEGLALFGVYVDVVTVGTDGYFGPIRIEGEGCDRSNMELVYLRGRHRIRQDGKAVDCRTFCIQP